MCSYSGLKYDGQIGMDQSLYEIHKPIFNSSQSSKFTKNKNWSVMGPSIRHLQDHEILLKSWLCLWYAVVVVVCTLQVTKFTHHLFQDWWWATLLFLKIIVKKSHVEHPSLSTVSLDNKLYYPQSLIHHVNSPCAAKLFLSPPTMAFCITPPCHYYTCAALDCVQSKHLHNTL
jgi:hypothetical protein